MLIYWSYWSFIRTLLICFYRFLQQSCQLEFYRSFANILQIYESLTISYRPCGSSHLLMVCKDRGVQQVFQTFIKILQNCRFFDFLLRSCWSYWSFIKIALFYALLSMFFLRYFARIILVLNLVMFLYRIWRSVYLLIVPKDCIVFSIYRPIAIIVLIRSSVLLQRSCWSTNLTDRSEGS